MPSSSCLSRASPVEKFLVDIDHREASTSILPNIVRHMTAKQEVPIPTWHHAIVGFEGSWGGIPGNKKTSGEESQVGYKIGIQLYLSPHYQFAKSGCHTKILHPCG
jgi:hypothetical protein